MIEVGQKWSGNKGYLVKVISVQPNYGFEIEVISSPPPSRCSMEGAQEPQRFWVEEDEQKFMRRFSLMHSDLTKETD